MAETPTGETVDQGIVSNDSGTNTAPVTDNGNADVQAAIKRAEQAEMRANQLKNELDKKSQAELSAKQKQLEEQQEWKQLYEQTESKLKEMQDEATAAVRAQNIQTATDTVFKEYPEHIVDVAKTAGLSLIDDSEAAKAALKSKLDEIKSKIGDVRPRSNNPSNPVQATERDALVSRQSTWEGSSMALAAVKGDLSPTYEYIRSLPAIQRMKEMSRGA